METTPALEQAECDDCDDDDIRAFDRDYEMTPDDDSDVHITRTVRCANCKAEGKIIVDYDGTTAKGCVSFENASWNEESDDE